MFKEKNYINKRSKYVVKLLLAEAKPYVPCLMKISSKGGDIRRGQCQATYPVEVGLAGSPSSSTAKNGSHCCDERDRACWAGQCRDDDEWGRSVGKGLGSGSVTC
jgi:hypothetical protein